MLSGRSESLLSRLDIMTENKDALRLQRAIEQAQAAQASTKATLALCDDLALLNERLRNETVRLAAERDDISRHRDALAEVDGFIRQCLLGELDAPPGTDVETLDTLSIMAAFLRHREEQFGQLHSELEAARQEKIKLEEKIGLLLEEQERAPRPKPGLEHQKKMLSELSTDELFAELERRSSSRTKPAKRR